MTIASEISRLQGAKADICTAIENKGVIVGNITLDEYAACINAIPTGPTYYCVDVMLVGGGGAGGQGSTGYAGGGGGGAGGVIIQCRYMTECMESCITIGAGGAPVNNNRGNSGGDTTGFGLIACGGGGGGGGTQCAYSGGSGGGGNGRTSCRGGNIYGQGNLGGLGCYVSNSENAGGGGGGAGMAGSNGFKSGSYTGGGAGGDGICTNFSGTVMCIAGGGGGSGRCGKGAGGMGGGGMGCPNCHGTCYGAGGGAWVYQNGCLGGCGYQGLAVVRYPANGDYGFSNATGGTKESKTIDGVTYCVHTFTSNGVFVILS